MENTAKNILVAFILLVIAFGLPRQLNAQLAAQKYSPNDPSLFTTPKIPTNIVLGSNCEFEVDSNGVETNMIDSCDNLTTISFDHYIKVVVASEMSAAWGNFNPDGGSIPEGRNALRAQAVAARSFAINYSLNNIVSLNPTVCDTEKCQRYDSGIAATINNSIYSPAREAVDSTKRFVLIDSRLSLGHIGIAPAYYAASTNSLVIAGVSKPLESGSTLCGSGNGKSGDPGWSNVSFFSDTSGYPCFFDAVLDGNGNAGVKPNLGYPRLGHGAGMSQTGALRWAIGTHWNPDLPFYRNADTDIDSTEWADSGDIGNSIPGFVVENRKDWRRILMHYYVYPFVSFKVTI